jgi:hypothetical protein
METSEATLLLFLETKHPKNRNKDTPFFSTTPPNIFHYTTKHMETSGTVPLLFFGNQTSRK